MKRHSMQTNAPGKSGVRIRFSVMLRWLIPMMVLVGGFGAMPTWMAARAPGLWAELSAGSIVLVVMVVNGWVTARAASGGRARVTIAFSASSVVRIIACLLLGWGVWMATRLPEQVLFIWMLIFYLVSMGVECTWVTVAVRRESA